MLIPINNIVKFGMPIASTYYDTVSGKYREGRYCERNLPVMDYLSCGICNIYNICTVVGVIKESDLFVVSYGGKILRLVDRLGLANTSNLYFSGGEFVCIDGMLQNMSELFPDTNIKYMKDMSIIENSSDGFAEKFLGEYRGRLCVVKFAKLFNKELAYEVLYCTVGNKLNVPVCESICSVYSGKICSISVLEYDIGKDNFTSLKSLGTTLDKLYTTLSDINKRRIDSQLLLDYLMSQQDRHMGNIALCNGDVYPMYDNGECLGLGTIGHFSSMYRRYIEHIDKSYLLSLINNVDVRDCFSGMQQEYNIFCNNWRELWG